MYIDGTLRGTTNYSGGTIPNSGRAIWVGGNEAWSDEYFAGRIDEVRLYNQALTQSEIQSLMGSGPLPMPSNCVTFDTGFTIGQTVGAHADWYDGGAGPVVTSGNGLGASVGLAPAANIFTWTNRPFNWNSPDLAGITLQMDFQTNASGQFDDDRMGWMTTDTSVDSINTFGVQLDTTEDGGIVTYWRDSNDVRVQTPIVPLSTLPANTWFRFWARITKLTPTSAKIDVKLVQLDAAGNPTGTPYAGTLADTSLWPDGAPDTRYFTATTMWPAYKNHNGTTGAADNACFNENPKRFAFVVTTDWHTSDVQPNTTVENNLQQIRYFMDNPTTDMPAPSFMVVTGDFPNVSQTQTSINNVLGSGFLWYPVIGNHEISDGISNFNYIRDTMVPSLPNIVNYGPAGSLNTSYSWDHGNAHFTVLNAYWNGGTSTGSDYAADGNIVPQLLSWINADLTATNQIQRFVFVHEPAYPHDRHQGDSLDQYPANRDAFVAALDSQGVEVLFTGHTHFFNHSTSAQYPLLGNMHQITNGYLRGYDGPTITYVLVDGDATTYKVFYRQNESSGFSQVDTWTIGGTPPPTEPPAAPTGLTATAVSSSQINLAWTDNANNEANFEIERAAAAGGPFALLTTISANMQAYNNTSLSPNTEYCYQVRATNVIGPSAYTSVACATTPVGPVTATFQNGLNGYTGTVDTHIMQSEPGVGHGTLDTLNWDTDDPSGTTQYNYALIRFDNIFGSGPGQIPAGSIIQSATLRYVVYNTGAIANVNETAVDWDGNVTWNTFGGDAGVQADEYGASRGTASGAAIAAQTVDVTASLAAWSNNPAANRGWIFRPTGTDGVDFRSSEYATIADRPSLTVQYITGTPGQYILAYNVVGNGSVTLNPPGGIYNAGVVVQLTANPDSGWTFSGWSGDLSGSANPASITMDGYKSVTATFVQGPPPTNFVCETFNSFVAGSNIGSYSGWYDGGTSGPIVTSGNGVAGSVGLASSGTIFTWAAHPFNWNATDFQGIALQMDFQTGANGQFDDDRLGWMTTTTSTLSDYIFGVQLDHPDGGIVTYWRNSAGTRIQTPIVTLPNPLPASTWYRFSAEFTKLTATSARIDVYLVQLDASGNPTGTTYTGTVADTSTWSGGAPANDYFTPTSMWPAYKNHTTSSGPADNACFEVVGGTPGPTPTTVTFQNGLNGYAGTVDTLIMQSEATTGHGALDTIDWDTDDPSGSGQYNYALIRFDNIFGSGAGQIPTGATIQSANLRYVVYEAGVLANVNEVAVDWTEDVTYNGFGAAAGVQAGDYGAARGNAGGSSGAQTIDVTASLAAWMNNPSANRGWIFRPTGTDGVDFRSSEYATIADRPSLTVQYTTGTPGQYSLTVNVVGSGSVDLSPSGGSYNSGAQVQLTANPAAGWTFSSWSGDLTGSANPANITMNFNKTVTATFTQGQQTTNLVCETFNAYTPGSIIGTYPGWFSDLSGSLVGPVVTAANGVDNSNGLAAGSGIFNWTAHPFNWNAADFQRHHPAGGFQDRWHRQLRR